jgi:hypothetical protein
MSQISIFLLFRFLCGLASSLHLETKIFLVVPGINLNSQQRYHVLMSNLNYLSPWSSFTSSTTLFQNQNNISLDCLIFIYQTSSAYSREEEALRNFCQLEYFYHGNYAYYLKSILPSFLILSGYTHIFLLLDDVELTQTFKSGNICLLCRS